MCEHSDNNSGKICAKKWKELGNKWDEGGQKPMIGIEIYYDVHANWK